MSLHRRRVHPDPVEGCWGCKVSTIQVAAEPTNDEQARQYRFQENFAAEFTNGDREAYRRLRADGLQPPRIAGSAHLERHASTRFEVETGQVTEKPKVLRDALQIARDGGFNPLQPRVTPKAVD